MLRAARRLRYSEQLSHSFLAIMNTSPPVPENQALDPFHLMLARRDRMWTAHLNIASVVW